MIYPTDDYGPLKAGTHYRVIREFTDFDGQQHDTGESWIFVGSSFLPYEDGLSLFVQPDGGAVRRIRLCCRPNDQGPIAGALDLYLSPIA